MVHIPFFGKKKKSDKPTIPASSRVMDLSSRGYSEPEIIRTLRDEGYLPIEIDRALKTTMKSAASEETATPLPPREFKEPGPPAEKNFYEEQPPQAPGEFDWMEKEPEPSREGKEWELPPLPAAEPFEPPRFKERELPKIPARRAPKEAIDRKELEEMIEGIVEEKWNLLEKDIGEMNEKFNTVNEKIRKLEEAIQRLQELRKTEKDEIRANLAAYRESVAEMTMKIDSIEKAMKDTLTPMLQTLRSMSEAMKSIKK
jgi:prefoldin subunit 5